MKDHLISKNYLLVLFIFLIPIMFARVSQNPRSVIWSDSEGYYKYLPAVFILKDVHQMPAGSVSPLLNEDGEYLNKYTCGVAYFQAPFFLMTLISVSPNGRLPHVVFSDPYAFSVALSGFFIGFLGLFFLQSALRRQYDEKVVIWTLFSVFFGTNLFHYTTREMGMSHVYSFALLAFILWHVPRFYEKANKRNALILGAALGWLALIRPTNILGGAFI